VTKQSQTFSIGTCSCYLLCLQRLDRKTDIKDKFIFRIDLEVAIIKLITRLVFRLIPAFRQPFLKEGVMCLSQFSRPFLAARKV